MVSKESELDIYVYDRSNQDAFLGHVKVRPSMSEDKTDLEGWFKLEGRQPDENVTGEIHLEMRFQKTDKRHYGPEDFQILKLIGKGESRYILFTSERI